MKRIEKKNILIATLGGVATACIAFAFAFTPVTAAADTYEGAFELAGASVRLATDENAKTGMRFVSTIPTSEYSDLTTNYDVEVGTLIIPQTELKGSLDFENTTDNIMHIEDIEPTESTQWNGYYEFRAVVSSIPEDYYDAEIIARAYMTLTSKTTSESTTIWSNTLSRNVAYVAYMASIDPDFSPSTAGQTAIESFIGDRVFNKVECGEDVVCDYDYAFVGQTLKVSMSNTDAVSVLSVTDENEVVLDSVNNTFVMPQTAVKAEKISVLDLDDLTDKRAASLWKLRTDSTGEYKYGELSFNNTVTMGEETKIAMTFYSEWNYDNWEQTGAGSIGSYSNLTYVFLDKTFVDYAISDGYTQINFKAATAKTAELGKGANQLGGRLRIATHDGKANTTFDGSSNMLGSASASDATSKWNTFTIDLSALTSGTLAIASSSDTLYISEVTLIKLEKIDFTKDFASEEMKDCWNYYGTQASVTYEKNVTMNGTAKDAIKLYGANHTADFNVTLTYLSAFYLKLDVMEQLKAEGYKKVNITFAYMQDQATSSNPAKYRAYIRTYVGDGSTMKHNDITVATTNAMHNGNNASTWCDFTWDLSEVKDGETFAISWWMQTMYISSITFTK